jgi:hypothetical protein
MASAILIMHSFYILVHVNYRLTQGFLATLGIILLVPTAFYTMLVLIIFFQWIGYAAGLALFIAPSALIIHRRERRTGEFDDKQFNNSEKALAWLVKEVEKRED